MYLYTYKQAILPCGFHVGAEDDDAYIVKSPSGFLLLTDGSTLISSEDGKVTKVSSEVGRSTKVWYTLCSLWYSLLVLLRFLWSLKVQSHEKGTVRRPDIMLGAHGGGFCVKREDGKL